MTSPSCPVLHLADVSFSYPDGHTVLRQVDLRVQAGERVGLVGPNGAGKSTLFLLSTGILAPTTGQVMLLGKPVAKGSFNPQLGLVFQHTDDQLFCPTVWEDVAFGLVDSLVTDLVAAAFAVAVFCIAACCFCCFSASRWRLCSSFNCSLAKRACSWA